MKEDKEPLVASSSLPVSQEIMSSCFLVSFRHPGVVFQKGNAECQARCESDPSSSLPHWVPWVRPWTRDSLCILKEDCGLVRCTSKFNTIFLKKNKWICTFLASDLTHPRFSIDAIWIGILSYSLFMLIFLDFFFTCTITLLFKSTSFLRSMISDYCQL